MVQQGPFSRSPMRWWDSGATEEAMASFLPVLLDLLTAAYRRAGEPDGPPDAEGEVVHAWFERIRDTEEGRALEQETQKAWMLHLRVRFAARQVN